MISPSNVLAYLDSKNKPTYTRDNFDAFLKDIKFKFNNDAIHITGTNGKGSVAYFLSKVLTESRYKVGRFISPTLSSPFEMITINEVEISEETFCNIINAYFDKFEAYGLTQFEIITFIALTYFKQEKVQLAVIEVGMGGEVDATNVFIPILSIITNVSVEHTAYLGKTLKEIATHKAGIIKKKTPVLVGNVPLEAFNVIAKKAMALNAPIYSAREATNIRLDKTGVTFDTLGYKHVTLAIPALYEATNASLALNALELIKDQYPVKAEVILKTLANITIPGRFSVLKENPLIIVDGAHNPSAIMTLINSLKHLTSGKVHVVFAAFRDKDIDNELNLFALANMDVVLTTFPHIRARKKEELPGNYPFYEDYHEAIRASINTATEEDVIVITGSLNFALLVHQEMAGK